jgi:glycosyltransferase involved in cell wall biosynthesis
MVDDFAAVAPTTVEPIFRVRRRLRRLRAGRWPAVALDHGVALAMLLIHRPGVVYVNSAAASVYLRPSRWLRRRTVLHLHESIDWIDWFLRRDCASDLFARTRLVACSPSIRKQVAERLGRPMESIRLIASVPDSARVQRLAEEAPGVEYGADELVVGCCGAVEERKGADLWTDIAQRVRVEFPDQRLRFVWVGAGAPPVTARANAAVEFLGASLNPYAHVKRFDVAVLPSRDDPFPLVVLEAMILGTPVVAFAVGGVAEQLGDAGVLVESGDTQAMSEAIVRLLRDPSERQCRAERGRIRAATRYSVERFAQDVRQVTAGSD